MDYSQFLVVRWLTRNRQCARSTAIGTDMSAWRLESLHLSSARFAVAYRVFITYPAFVGEIVLDEWVGLFATVEAGTGWIAERWHQVTVCKSATSVCRQRSKEVSLPCSSSQRASETS